MPRMLKYQVEHVEQRLRRIARKKLATIDAQCERAVKRVKQVKLYTDIDALQVVWQGDKPKQVGKKFIIRKGAHLATYSNQASYGIDLLGYTGLDKANERILATRERKVDLVRKPFATRRKKCHREMQRVIDSIILNGAEGFEEALNKFEKEIF